MVTVLEIWNYQTAENNGAINGRYSAGGIAQCIENKNSNEAEVSNCINNGNVFGGAEAAGIIDYAEGITVTNCINNGNISSNWLCRRNI